MNQDAPRLFVVSYLDEDVDVDLVPALLCALLNFLDQVSADEAKNQLFYLLNFEEN